MIAGVFIRNFKSYENNNFIPFLTSSSDRMTIFAGDNGAGKSAILESMNCLMNNLDSKEWAVTIGQKKDRVSIFPVFLIKRDEWDPDGSNIPQLSRISYYFWEYDFSDSSNNDTTKKFLAYRSQLKTWYNPEEYYLISIGKDYDGNILLTTTFHNKIANSTKKDGVSKDKINTIFKKIIERYKYIYLPVENKISDALSLQANELQGMMDKSVADEIRTLLSKKDQIHIQQGSKKVSVIDLINNKLDSYIEELNKKIPNGYKFEYRGAIKRQIKPSDILDAIFAKYFSLRPLSKNSKHIRNLSSGEQRIALIDIATTLLSTSEKTNKEVILAIDEPEVSLESAHRFEQFSTLIDLSENFKRQIFLTTHWYGLILRPMKAGLHYIVKDDDSTKIQAFPLINIQESRRSFPNSIEIRSYFDLMASMLTLLKKREYNWIFCEGSEDYLYLNAYLKNSIPNLFILPFNGCGNIKKIFDFLHVPFSDKQENKEIKGKVLCLIDNDTKNIIRYEGYNASLYKNKLGFFRLLIDNDSSDIITVANTNAINTEMEDLLEPSLFYQSIVKIADEDSDLADYLSNYELDESKKFTNLSASLSFLRPKNVKGYESCHAFYQYLTTNSMKSKISENYTKDISKIHIRDEDVWLKKIVNFFVTKEA
ncbi:AAA family ATPase [Serratia marcescens]|uniref:AAA family ATPase n=1 Tax=Serratia marcescens TaxID=615 RepID=UPI00066A59E8|nr:AAA family ATPase [Serratia marcescens]MDI3442881.1 AAA family ATPase [Serratia marcescens]